MPQARDALSGFAVLTRNLRLPAQHCVERRGETLTTAREAGTPTRLVRSNALLCGAHSQAVTRRLPPCLPPRLLCVARAPQANGL